MFEKHKHDAAMARWTQYDQTLRGLLFLLEHGGGPGGGGPDVALVLKPKEKSVYLLTGGGLFEPRRGPGHYKGASSGISIPIGSTGARYRIGQSRGTYVQGAETQTKIDTGSIVFTTTRVVFLGTQRTVEWAFSKLVAIQHYRDRPWTAIQVSNRQKVTGVIYDPAHSENLRLRLEAALALFNNSTDELISQVRAAMAANDADKPPDLASATPRPAPTPLPRAPTATAVSTAPAWPVAPPGSPAPPPPVPPPDWFPDPARRHEYRYWDGRSWTEAVSDRGIAGADPL